MEREIIYGVVDKMGKCDSYIGFFKTEEDALKELENQSKYLTFDYGFKDLKIENQKVTKKDGNVDVILYTIHSYVLR